ncbi:MAG: hypothetical protein UW92_C0019G0013 [Candidatus Jorgensenbacteria bacterium GW2011_GWA2_45_13]|uniref:Uncharacterized protein n=1 Tax=Candidatus Jorgensenbacteria bacterium GW2011_GWA2_45_13 TaxID=1618662 RepID=A0A0G1L5G7_9BACT|nr:MAG: hypothetical protein UW92_C0019G0013 [Candidatus Jorgensenbacteria bacterium GW2011_GWA2_45_13]
MPKIYTERSRSEIATKTKKEIHYRCKKCGDEIYWNTHKKLTHCNCKRISVDACLPVGRVACPSVALAKEDENYVRVGGNEGDYKVIHK